MKKTIFVVIRSQYYFKYITNKSFKELENKYNLFYLFNDQNFKKKDLKVENKIFYNLDKKSSSRIIHFLHYLRFSNHKKCKTFKATTEWYYPSFHAFKQIYKQDNLKNSFIISYLKIFVKKILMKFFSIKYLYNFLSNFFYTKFHIEDNLNQIFQKYKPDLVIYPSHGMEPEVIKIQKLSDLYKFKTFHIIDNWDNLTTSTYYKFKPNYLGVWGTQTKNHAIKFQNFNKKNIFLIGNCRFDNYFNLKKKSSKKTKLKYILFVACKIRVDEIYYLQLLNKILNKNKEIFKDTKIIYRPHPQDENFEYLKQLENLENVIIDKTVFTDKRTQYFKNDINLLKKNYLPLVLNAKFLVGCVSSVTIEGLILNKSYLVIAFKKKFDDFYNPKWWSDNFIHWSGFNKVSNVMFCYSEKQYEKKFIKMFNSQNNKISYSKNKSELDYFYHKDKLSYSKNIFKIVEKII